MQKGSQLAKIARKSLSKRKDVTILIQQHHFLILSLEIIRINQQDLTILFLLVVQGQRSPENNTVQILALSMPNMYGDYDQKVFDDALFHQ